MLFGDNVGVADGEAEELGVGDGLGENVGVGCGVCCTSFCDNFTNF